MSSERMDDQGNDNDNSTNARDHSDHDTGNEEKSTEDHVAIPTFPTSLSAAASWPLSSLTGVSQRYPQHPIAQTTNISLPMSPSSLAAASRMNHHNVTERDQLLRALAGGPRHVQQSILASLVLNRQQQPHQHQQHQQYQQHQQQQQQTNHQALLVEQRAQIMAERERQVLASNAFLLRQRQIDNLLRRVRQQDGVSASSSDNNNAAQMAMLASRQFQQESAIAQQQQQQQRLNNSGPAMLQTYLTNAPFIARFNNPNAALPPAPPQQLPTAASSSRTSKDDDEQVDECSAPKENQDLIAKGSGGTTWDHPRTAAVGNDMVNHDQGSDNATAAALQHDIMSTSSAAAAAMPTTDVVTGDTSSAAGENFPFKLSRMLEETSADGQEDIVSFLKDGQSFIIYRPKKFEAVVMPKYFSTNRMASFQRQLNLYGFKRIPDGPYKGSYFHPYFVKGRKELCKKIKRQKTTGLKDTRESSAQDNTAMITKSSDHTASSNEDTTSNIKLAAFSQDTSVAARRTSPGEQQPNNQAAIMLPLIQQQQMQNLQRNSIGDLSNLLGGTTANNRSALANDPILAALIEQYQQREQRQRAMQQMLLLQELERQQISKREEEENARKDDRG